MPQFAANLSMLYPELDFLDRFEAAAQDGFTGVEYLFPYEFPTADIKARLDTNGLQQVLFNAPPGSWSEGERGIACLPGRQNEFRDGLKRAIDYACALACPRIHVMAGIVPATTSLATLNEIYRDNLEWASEQARAQSCTVLIEPINTRDMPGYFLNRQDQAHTVVSALGTSNLKVQMDLYHCQIVEGDIEAKLRQYLPTGRVGHLQIAGVPHRHEPDTGELDYRYLFDVIDQLTGPGAWEGWVGCEYRPRAGSKAGGTHQGLAWLRNMKEAA